jgi:hypothetical protein
MVISAVVWAYWMSFFWLGADIIALTILSIEYYRKALKPGWELKRLLAEQRRGSQSVSNAPHRV